MRIELEFTEPGQYVRVCLALCDMTQVWLAQAANISPATVSNLCKGAEAGAKAYAALEGVLTPHFKTDVYLDLIDQRDAAANIQAACETLVAAGYTVTPPGQSPLPSPLLVPPEPDEEVVRAGYDTSNLCNDAVGPSCSI